MKIYTALRKGEGHPIYCEDFLIHFPLGDHFYLACVMDGCSSGKDSHFASALIGKLINKVGRQISSNQDMITTDKNFTADEMLKTVLDKFFYEFKKSVRILSLSISEILSTLILLLYDTDVKNGIIFVAGDGLISIDGVIHSIDQDNMPDYIAYHLHEDFEQWYQSQKNIFQFIQPKDISISSDGIETFKNLPKEDSRDIQPLEFLVIDTQFQNNQLMLKRKLNILENKHGYTPADDISIIRILFG
jgi:Protein phosphatase 2C